MSNIANTIQTMIDAALAQFCFTAEVISVGGGGVTVKPIGAQYAINQTITILTSYTGAATNDVVLVLCIAGSYWVLGKK